MQNQKEACPCPTRLVSQAAQIERNAYAQTKDESHKEIADKMEQMIQEGHEGKESGQGFYNYPNPAFMDPDFLKH